MTDLIPIQTAPCPRCGTKGIINVPKINYEKWKSGEIPYVQNAFPMLDAGQREQLMSGYHDRCYDLDAAFFDGLDDLADDEEPF